MWLSSSSSSSSYWREGEREFDKAREWKEKKKITYKILCIALMVYCANTCKVLQALMQVYLMLYCANFVFCTYRCGCSKRAKYIKPHTYTKAPIPIRYHKIHKYDNNNNKNKTFFRYIALIFFNVVFIFLFFIFTHKLYPF